MRILKCLFSCTLATVACISSLVNNIQISFLEEPFFFSDNILQDSWRTTYVPGKCPEGLVYALMRTERDKRDWRCGADRSW